MSTMERILRLMAEKNASDVYLSANAPALIKINGECVQINNQILPPEAPKNLLAEVVPPHRIEELEETGELNMGVPLTGVGRFRVSAMRQRGSYAVVIRFISQHIPELSELSLPAVLGDLIVDAVRDPRQPERMAIGGVEYLSRAMGRLPGVDPAITLLNLHAPRPRA